MMRPVFPYKDSVWHPEADMKIKSTNATLFHFIIFKENTDWTNHWFILSKNKTLDSHYLVMTDKYQFSRLKT